jgi:uncharacterized integral membrane protein
LTGDGRRDRAIEERQIKALGYCVTDTVAVGSIGRRNRYATWHFPNLGCAVSNCHEGVGFPRSCAQRLANRRAATPSPNTSRRGAATSRIRRPAVAVGWTITSLGMGVRSIKGATLVTDRELGASEEVGTEQSPTDAAATSPAPVAPSATEPSTPGRRGKSRGSGERHTRISGAWAAVAVTTVLGVALVDFIVENTRSVEIHFFSVSGRLSVAAALLAAALAGAAVVLAIGVARTAQLRLSIRHHRKANDAAAAVPVDDRRAGPDSELR